VFPLPSPFLAALDVTSRLSLEQQYLTGQLWQLNLIMILPFVYIAWTKFLRNGFTLSFVIEEGESLREIKSKWFVGLDKEGQHMNIRFGNRTRDRTQRTIFIDGNKVVYTDRFNKRHLIYPVNNAFAFHPFADEILIPSTDITKVSDTIKSKAGGFLGLGKIVGDTELESTDTVTRHIHPTKIKLISLIKFDSIKLFKYFFGSAMEIRVNQANRAKKVGKEPYILGAIIGALIIFALVSAQPQSFGLEHIATTINNATNQITTTSTTSSSVLHSP
jgi:hypothetical protein